ncbi:MAG TPA: toll/interleukin-1 receptor domain-containing protein [Nitrospirota bacterium]|nr:toll/interleukin-1 receptor domain-containing protein [Nitrospirota bacterium]
MPPKHTQQVVTTTNAPLETSRVPRANPTVFISHDGRDADLAEAFGNLLTDVSGGILKPFCSSDRKGTRGIEFGEEWFKTIMAKLGEATDVVALLTQHSIDRPWILYETGVAKGKSGTPAFGVAIGVPLEKASTGPFAQFQNCAADDDSLTKLAIQLIRRNPDASPREEAVRRHVVAFLESVSALMKKRGAPGHGDGSSKVDETTIAKLFEEVKVMFRALPENVEEKLGRSMRRGIIGREREIHPMMIEDMLFNTMNEDKMAFPGLGWLIFVSLFRDDLPWFYELGMEVYHAIESQSADRVATSARRLRQAVDICMRGPIGEMFMGRDDMRGLRVLRHFPDMLDHFLNRIEGMGGLRRPRKGQLEDKA